MSLSDDDVKHMSHAVEGSIVTPYLVVMAISFSISGLPAARQRSVDFRHPPQRTVIPFASARHVSRPHTSRRPKRLDPLNDICPAAGGGEGQEERGRAGLKRLHEIVVVQLSGNPEGQAAAKREGELLRKDVARACARFAGDPRKIAER
jgi:hypothetical protein